MFRAAEGGPIHDDNFRERIWYPGVAAARLCGRPPAPNVGEQEYQQNVCHPEACDDPAHRIRRFPPGIMRHTAASHLVMDGAPLYDVQALLGHESFTTTQRYAHLAPGAHGKTVHVARRNSRRPPDDADTPVTHDHEKPHPSAEE